MGSSSSRNLDASRVRSSRRERGFASDACRNQSEGRNSHGQQQENSRDGATATIYRLDGASPTAREAGSGTREQIQIEISRESVASSSLEARNHARQCLCSDMAARGSRESVFVEVENPQSSEAGRSTSSCDGDKDLESDDECAEEKLDRSSGEELAPGSSSGEGENSSSETTSSRDSTSQQLDRDSSRIFEEIPELVRADPSGRESRRNSGRRFWDALTRAASHRRSSAPITIVAIEEIDDNGSSTSRWNFQHWRSSDHTEGEERRRHVRSHIWALQRLSGGLQISHGHARTCPAAGQFNGLCSCETQSSEDSTTRASISRIIMLAEALFEVLDEIHRQTLALSHSAGMPLTSLPAPDAVVNSIPVRSYNKLDVHSEETAQCHICLVEYEDGDQIRILPCQHEYHQACVDRWLKEVHRVCPLCRRNVCCESIAATENCN